MWAISKLNQNDVSFADASHWEFRQSSWHNLQFLLIIRKRLDFSMFFGHLRGSTNPRNWNIDGLGRASHVGATRLLDLLLTSAIDVSSVFLKQLWNGTPLFGALNLKHIRRLLPKQLSNLHLRVITTFSSSFFEFSFTQNLRRSGPLQR